MYPNNWRGRDFTGKELDQIADLIERFYTADYRPIDKRRYTHDVLQFDRAPPGHQRRYGNRRD